MSKKINIALVQTTIYWEDIQGNLNKFDGIINSMNPKVDIIFLPEMFNSGFSMNVNKIAETMDGKSTNGLKNFLDYLQIIMSFQLEPMKANQSS